MQLAFELGRERNPSVVAHDRRSKLSRARSEVADKTQEFDHWATEADKHISHKVRRIAPFLALRYSTTQPAPLDWGQAHIIPLEMLKKCFGTLVEKVERTAFFMCSSFQTACS